VNVRRWVKITPTEAIVDGKLLDTKATGAALLTELYRNYTNDYPKFFKMDELSKLGFIAAELLLKGEDENHAEREDRAVILFNRCSSICNDRKYQDTISRPDDFFPSPSIFVYTLPNIVTGEIAIRHHYYGETAFYVLDEPDETLMRQVIAAAFADDTTTSVLTGWVDCETHDNFYAHIYVIDK